jgi:hypothetical protein
VIANEFGGIWRGPYLVSIVWSVNENASESVNPNLHQSEKNDLSDWVGRGQHGPRGPTFHGCLGTCGP